MQISIDLTVFIEHEEVQTSCDFAAECEELTPLTFSTVEAAADWLESLPDPTGGMIRAYAQAVREQGPAAVAKVRREGGFGRN